jgi:hypothetical protein
MEGIARLELSEVAKMRAKACLLLLANNRYARICGRRGIASQIHMHLDTTAHVGGFDQLRAVPKRGGPA